MNNPETDIIGLGPNARFHHTVLRPDSHNLTYGGLWDSHQKAHQSQKGLANKELKGWLRDFLTPDITYSMFNIFNLPAAIARFTEWRRSPIIELTVGQEYRPWGTGLDFVHGVSDGFHGSRIQDEQTRGLLHAQLPQQVSA